MNAPTLGYEDDSTLSKREIAQMQLVEAINLFLQGKYVCRVTLAGAAEAVMSGLLDAEGKLSAVEESTTRVSSLLAAIGLKSLRPKKDTEHYNEWNKARNALKHFDHKKDSDTVTLNQFDEAYWMIERALHNADLLAVDIANRDAYRNWVIVNINM